MTTVHASSKKWVLSPLADYLFTQNNRASFLATKRTKAHRCERCSSTVAVDSARFRCLVGQKRSISAVGSMFVCLFLCLILLLVQVLLIWPAANFPPFCRAESLRRSHELIVKSAAPACKSCQQKRTHSRSSSDNVVFSCVSATFICWPQYIESVKKHLHRVVECCPSWDNFSSTSSSVSIPSSDLRQKMYNQLSQLTVSLSPTTRRVIIFVPPLLLGGFYLLRRYV